MSVATLREVDRDEALLIIPCSKAKAEDGERGVLLARAWPEPLLRARAALRDRARVDESRLRPAYRRYTGGFYREAGIAITAAVDSGAPLIVISGGGRGG